MRWWRTPSTTLASFHDAHVFGQRIQTTLSSKRRLSTTQRTRGWLFCLHQKRVSAIPCASLDSRDNRRDAIACASPMGSGKRCQRIPSCINRSGAIALASSSDLRYFIRFRIARHQLHRRDESRFTRISKEATEKHGLRQPLRRDDSRCTEPENCLHRECADLASTAHLRWPLLHLLCRNCFQSMQSLSINRAFAMAPASPRLKTVT